MIFARRFFSWSLCLTLAIPSGLSHAEAAPGLNANLQVSPTVVEKAQQLREPGALLRSRLARSITPLASVGKFGAEVIQLQALLILASAMAVQVQKEHRELEALANGRPLPMTESDETCGSENFSVRSGLFCSGEFYLGLLGGAIGIGGTKIGGAIIQGLFKSTVGRSGLAKFIGAMLSNAAMVSGATSASFLWGEAVKALPSSKMIQQARGVAGRAGLALSQGQWNSFASSSDGEIFNLILTGLQKIAIQDERTRDQWLYNTWRFGIARGEFLTALASLMAASVSGEVLTACAAAAAASAGASAVAVGLSAPVLSFVIGSAIGFGAFTLLLDASAPKKLTSVIQNLRVWGNSNWLEQKRLEIEILSQGFSMRRGSVITDKNYIAGYQRQYQLRLADIQKSRQQWINAGIERFYELKLEQRLLQMKIGIAEATLRNADLSQNIYIEQDGRIVSLNEAKAKLCAADTNTNCEVPLAFQLKAMEQYRALFNSSETTLVQIADALVAKYDEDVALIDKVTSNPDSYLPPSIVEQLTQQRLMANTLGQSMRLTLACSAPSLMGRMGLKLNSLDEQKSCQKWAEQELSIYYTQVYYEDEVFKSIQEAQP